MEPERIWTPLSLPRLRNLFASAEFPWWVAGGYAIELAVGHSFREHEDIDVLILRRDQTAVRRWLAEWECWAADPPSRLRPWQMKEVLPLGVHDVWCREGPGAPWCFSLMLDEADGDMWYSRRDARVRKAVTQLTARQASTSPFLAPDAQLYYKAKNSRPKDEMDFTEGLPILTSDERAWLSQAIILTYGESHAWLPRIGNCSG